MEENPYKPPDRTDHLPAYRSTRVKVLTALCLSAAAFRMLTWIIGTLRMLAVSDRLENSLAVFLLVILPPFVVADWAATAIAIWRNRQRLAAVGFAIGLCDFLVLSFVESPVAM